MQFGSSATYQVALERVASGPARKLSKNAELLRRSYDWVESLLPSMPPSDWTFDTTTTSWQVIVDELATPILTERR